MINLLTYKPIPPHKNMTWYYAGEWIYQHKEHVFDIEYDANGTRCIRISNRPKEIAGLR